MEKKDVIIFFFWIPKSIYKIPLVSEKILNHYVSELINVSISITKGAL